MAQANVIGAVAPGQVVMGSASDPFKGASEVIVKQEWAAIEFCSLEAKQRYRISQPVGPEKAEGEPFLYITEESGCLERICCSTNRSLTLKLHDGPTKEAPVIQRMHKPFSLQGCCFCRPSFTVTGAGGEGDLVGTVEDPCRCCTMDQQVYGKDKNLLFTTAGSICQFGMCCPCCAPIHFDVKQGGSDVASIEKMTLSCAEMCTKTNRFLVNFDKITDPEAKRMLLASAMLLDLGYFEQNKN